jgi:6-phosphofructokinase
VKPLKLAIMTGGGDAPGLNGIIESCSKTMISQGHEVIGICDGFEGIFENRTKKITAADLEGIHSEAGTYLGTSNKSSVIGREEEFKAQFRKIGADAMIVAGGDGTFSALARLGASVPILGVPKTIDNDLSGTEITFGYDTACSVVAQAVDALRSTASAHHRVLIVETMGRTAGWIALGGGLSSYADVILLPELPFSKAKLVDFIRAKQAQGQRHLMVVVSEGAFAEGEDPSIAFNVPGAPQTERYGGIAERLARWIEKELSWESRHVVLGHLQRASHPTTTDRFLTLSMGVEIARLANERAWGQAVVYRNGRILRAPITDLQGPPRLVDPKHRWIDLARALGVFI